MNGNIVKICKRHGELKQEDCRFQKNGKFKECKYCRKEYRQTDKFKLSCARRFKKYYEKNKEILKQKAKNYLLANHELAKKKKRDFYWKNIEKIKLMRQTRKEKDNITLRKYRKKSSSELLNWYVASKIRIRGGLIKTKDIPMQIIEAKRLHIKLKRKLKELRNGN